MRVGLEMEIQTPMARDRSTKIIVMIKLIRTRRLSIKSFHLTTSAPYPPFWYNPDAEHHARERVLLPLRIHVIVDKMDSDGAGSDRGWGHGSRARPGGCVPVQGYLAQKKMPPPRTLP